MVTLVGGEQPGVDANLERKKTIEIRNRENMSVPWRTMTRGFHSIREERWCEP